MLGILDKPAFFVLLVAILVVLLVVLVVIRASDGGDALLGRHELGDLRGAATWSGTLPRNSVQ